jgi:hypothetical protein
MRRGGNHFRINNYFSANHFRVKCRSQKYDENDVFVPEAVMNEALNRSIRQSFASKIQNMYYMKKSIIIVSVIGEIRRTPGGSTRR